MLEKISNLSSLVSEKEALVKDVELKLKSYETEKELLNNELVKCQELNQNLISSQKDAEKSSEEDLQRIKAECESLKKNEETLKTNIVELNKNIIEKEKLAAEYKCLVEDTEKKFEKEKSTFLIKIESLTKEKLDLEMDFSKEKDNLKRVNQEIEKKLNKLNLDLANYQNDSSSSELLNQLNQEIDELSDKLKKQESNETQIKNDYEATIKDLKDMIKETFEQNEKLNTEISDLSSRFETYETEIRNNKELIEYYESENSELKHQVELLKQNAQSNELNKKTKYKLVSELKAPPRLYCDICDKFDFHNTEDCPQQSMPSNPNYPDPNELATHSQHNFKKESNRLYCDECEVFGHDESECPNQKSNVSDEEF